MTTLRSCSHGRFGIEPPTALLIIYQPAACVNEFHRGRGLFAPVTLIRTREYTWPASALHSKRLHHGF